MLLELLDTPERRETILPEIVRFFRKQCGEDWRKVAEAFCTNFAAMEFKVPGPEFFVAINRDTEIVRAIERDNSPENRLEILRRHSLTYTYLMNLWLAAKDRSMPTARAPTDAETINKAATLIRCFPSHVTDIVMMMALTATERASAHDAARRLPAPRGSPPRRALSAAQTRILREMRTRGGKVRREEIDRLCGRKQAVTIQFLMRQGFIDMDNGMGRLTSKGEDAIA